MAQNEGDNVDVVSLPEMLGSEAEAITERQALWREIVNIVGAARFQRDRGSSRAAQRGTISIHFRYWLDKRLLGFERKERSYWLDRTATAGRIEHVVPQAEISDMLLCRDFPATSRAIFDLLARSYRICVLSTDANAQLDKKFRQKMPDNWKVPWERYKSAGIKGEFDSLEAVWAAKWNELERELRSDLTG